LHRKIGSPDAFFVFEQYENEDAIKHHSSTPHFLAYRQATGHLVTGRDVSRWQVTV
jgi:quinol monooxygenase YgiN